MILEFYRSEALQGVMNPKWTQWWQTDVPCRFSSARAKENALFLTDLLGSQWVEKVQTHPGSTNHLLIQRWNNNGANAFLELNALAEDARLLEGMPGFEGIVADLKNSDRALPTWHALHCAALFERAHRGEGAPRCYES